jgi:hypothetical protein
MPGYKLEVFCITEFPSESVFHYAYEIKPVTTKQKIVACTVINSEKLRYGKHVLRNINYTLYSNKKLWEELVAYFL